MSRENVFQDGPYLTAALLCEHILEEKDGVKSLIRVVDRIIIRIQGIDVPEPMSPIQRSLALFLSMKTGEKPGKHAILIKFIRPDKTEAPPYSHRVNLEPQADRGFDLVMNMNLTLEQEGLYWFEIYWDGLLMTRVPLSVLYFTQSSGKDRIPAVVQ